MNSELIRAFGRTLAETEWLSSQDLRAYQAPLISKLLLHAARQRFDKAIINLHAVPPHGADELRHLVELHLGRRFGSRNDAELAAVGRGVGHLIGLRAQEVDQCRVGKSGPYHPAVCKNERDPFLSKDRVKRGEPDSTAVRRRDLDKSAWS